MSAHRRVLQKVFISTETTKAIDSCILIRVNIKVKSHKRHGLNIKEFRSPAAFSRCCSVVYTGQQKTWPSVGLEAYHNIDREEKR